MEAVLLMFNGGSARSKEYELHFKTFDLEEKAFGCDRSAERKALQDRMDNDTECLPYLLYKENEKALELFIGVSTQWLCSMGGFYGLNYQSLVSVSTIKGIVLTEEVFHKIQACEAAALEYFRKAGKKKNGSRPPAPPKTRRNTASRKRPSSPDSSAESA